MSLNDSFSAMRALVLQILKHPFEHDWSLQGFGQLRLYLSETDRLHVWVPQLAVPAVSTIHDHPWNFESLVISGYVINVKPLVEPDCLPEAATHNMAQIRCGPGGGIVGDPVRVRVLQPDPSYIHVGHSYFQNATEFHESKPSAGAVTLCRRFFRDDRDHAHVCYPIGSSWVSAEPRPATREEVHLAISQAVSLFGI